MSQDSIGGTNGAVEPESEYVFVVYDRGSGAIHHIHQVVNLPGAEDRGHEYMEQTALGYVSPEVREQKSVDLAVLSVSPRQLRRGTSYRVDHERQVLVAVERER
jgi:hypothetical protein